MASQAVLSKLERSGQGVLQPAAALATLGSLLRREAQRCQPVVTVNPFNWQRYLQQGEPVPPFFSEFAGEHRSAAPETGVSRAAVRGGQPQQLQQQQRQQQLKQEWTAAEVAAKVEAAVEKVVGTSVGRGEPLMSSGRGPCGVVQPVACCGAVVRVWCFGHF